MRLDFQLLLEDFEMFLCLGLRLSDRLFNQTTFHVVDFEIQCLYLFDQLVDLVCLIFEKMMEFLRFRHLGFFLGILALLHLVLQSILLFF